MAAGAKSSPGPAASISQDYLRLVRRSVAPKSAKILVVDDDPLMRACVARALQADGYEVIEAESAETALDLLMIHRQALAALLSDVCLPGASGADLVGQARFLAPGLPTLLMSATSKAYLVDQCVVRADTELLQKPFSMAALLARLDQLLDLDEREG